MVTEIESLIHGEHYLAVMLILILSWLLLNRNIQSERVHPGSFWVTILVCFLLIIQDVLENFAQMDPSRRELRLFTSIIGYSLRPAAVLGFLLVVWPTGKPRWYLWIPIVLNMLLYSTALYSPLTFSFDENYAFHRGPLGGVMFYICILYLILTLFMVHRRFRDRRAGDIFVIYLCAFGCIGATVIDILIGGVTVVSAILISSLTFYLFLRAQDMDHDPLTGLWNRMTFYEDCRKMKGSISAVAMVDMNGLKKINDELGHEAGDRALRMIGKALHDNMNRKSTAYRIGGDEFTILYNHCNDTEISQVLIAFLDEVYRVGLSVSVGVATRQESHDSVDEMIRLSDWRMYEEKSKYYINHDRRKR